jgi:hypothetical protein
VSRVEVGVCGLQGRVCRLGRVNESVRRWVVWVKRCFVQDRVLCGWLKGGVCGLKGVLCRIEL